MDFLIPTLDDASTALLRAKLDDFARKNREEVVLQQIEWETFWRELVNVSVHQQGADVAEIGSTWVEPLMAMNVLAPFSGAEINAIGGKGSFFPAFWQSVEHESDPNACWGIPSRMDIRMIFYWQDMFDAAKVEPQRAFSSPEAMTAAFSRLRHSVQHPWGEITSKSSAGLVYNVASWVWAEGGDFISPDGKKLLINTREGRHGIRKHYELIEFMPPECRNSSHEVVADLFATRKIAAMIGGPWLFTYLKNVGLTPTMIDLVNVISPPGPPFIGGSVFIRWKHTRKPDLAGKLIKVLSEKDFNLAFSNATNWLPSHQAAWSDEFLCQNKGNPEYLKGLQSGRCLPSVRLWGMIEDRLTQMFGSMWDDLYALNEQARSTSVDKIMAKYLEPLAVRFETILKDYHRP
ncbi:MAG TPA: extracellular solute-binding protein [Anaerolineales bacterium]|nr:extracellular solute-binding protein [Anaerolineales bacterium]